MTNPLFWNYKYKIHLVSDCLIHRAVKGSGNTWQLLHRPGSPGWTHVPTTSPSQALPLRALLAAACWCSRLNFHFLPFFASVLVICIRKDPSRIEIYPSQGFLMKLYVYWCAPGHLMTLLECFSITNRTVTLSGGSQPWVLSGKF